MYIKHVFVKILSDFGVTVITTRQKLAEVDLSEKRGKKPTNLLPKKEKKKKKGPFSNTVFEKLHNSLYKILWCLQHHEDLCTIYMSLSPAPEPASTCPCRFPAEADGARSQIQSF